MADPPVEKISIPGPTLATIMQSFTTSNADFDGLLFGHVRSVSSPNLADDDDQTALRQDLVATITACTTSGFLHSFYDSIGRIDHAKLAKLSGQQIALKNNHDPLIGWFVARRNTPLRPSMREAAVTSWLRRSASTASVAAQNYLSVASDSDGSGIKVSEGGYSPRVSKSGLGLPYSSESSSSSQASRGSPRREKGAVVKDKVIKEEIASRICGIPASSPCVFLIFSESLSQHSIHTHEYRGFQYLCKGERGVFEAKSLDIVNIGPGFRSVYSAFSPVSAFPLLPSGFQPLQEDDGHGHDNREDRHRQKGERGQRSLDMYSAGYSVDRFGKLVRSDAMHVVSEIEELYGGMILQMEHLAKQVAESSQVVAKQEQHNMKLRYKLAGIE
ncbi:hypothetical protein SUGI_0756150 [Cryptomeria japonica]|uniref:uncharacterized protein LOC131029654 n=1 Tax=Cryptomeria japonica TaxID=3369 RepID=UPI002414CA64|nr:uncharacterized protein LOC131029654 [Cryptomeria japonica]XP_057816206.2 uncharacterized protein LOC131029654 [Cryptomeria japonica]GLJ37277.1 hypothetical protein SUGI_0756150 [Cryptomeria japonica]